ncbi:hypothetical protein MUK42_13051 [Musa troglodytarum]|uniref:Uncharacterized protein n=1 Tax=Musa troglodytarum TaxID=320322 RepID=A0A9E7HK51_9LILI|nr:hypothetical protein MUK42_13051 [Musa troglodytarum]
MRKSKFHKDKDIQIEGAVFRGLENGDQKEEILLESFMLQSEAMSCSNKLKRPSLDNYTEISSVLQMKRRNTMKIRVKFEKPDRLRTVTGGVSDSRKESSIDQVRGRAIYCFKQPKDESNFEGCIDEASCDVLMDLRIPKPATVLDETCLLLHHPRLVFRRKNKVDVMRDVICNSCENREMGRMLGQKYQQSPDDLTIILASGEGGKSDPFSSFEVEKRKARYRKLHNLFSTPKQT